MTPSLLAKIRRLADDPRTDPMTRKIAQAQLDTHNGVTETPGVVPGMRQTPEYQAYAKAMREANRGRKTSDTPYLTTMNEVLTMVVEFAEEARNSQDDVRMGAYLRMASRSLRLALEIYADRLGQNRAEMEQGERSEKVSNYSNHDL